MPIETVENDLPIVYLKKELVCDSGGPGRFRGGLGQEFELYVPDGDLAPVGPVMISIRGSGRSPDSPYPVFGRLGGKPGRSEGLTVN